MVRSRRIAIFTFPGYLIQRIFFTDEDYRYFLDWKLSACSTLGVLSFQIRIAASYVQLRGLVQHVLSPRRI
jgi:hypothetical protein